MYSRSRIFAISFGAFLIVSCVSICMATRFGAFEKVQYNVLDRGRYSKNVFIGCGYGIAGTLGVSGIVVILCAIVMNNVLVSVSSVINIIFFVIAVMGVAFYSNEVRNFLMMNENKAREFQPFYNCCGYKDITNSTFNVTDCASEIGITTQTLCFDALKPTEYAEYQGLVTMMYSVVMFLTLVTNYRLLLEELSENSPEEVTIFPSVFRQKEEIEENQSDEKEENNPLLDDMENGNTIIKRNIAHI
ncbi:hypothetical protein EIN_371570 [Entamoeba invadens IP1]|uniref:Uncharacterized protein n=2 Tax=Entamoeba invadens TaxID=33085 RepID=A0A0A1UBZ7_ENTIV|nr:hypothetical protein EIN_371570 [Entamoeba invadens IP1]ELP92745.1 hypothetical protein EIN_371570 [Entamoeba invadens IP1]BAN42231.1 hypothetical protein [Entamoeba invadens]|eukprot:XP_004259516.1 hypothetical protein EIN_371570 [Entamoeba invadens IP1]